MNIVTLLNLSPQDIRMITEFSLVMILVGAFCAIALSNLESKPNDGD